MLLFIAYIQCDKSRNPYGEAVTLANLISGKGPAVSKVFSHVLLNCDVSVSWTYVSSWRKSFGSTIALKLFFSVNLCLPPPPQLNRELKRERDFQETAGDVKWSIQLLSVCHCQRGHQRTSPCKTGRRLTQRGRRISSLSPPKGEDSASENCMHRENKILYVCKLWIYLLCCHCGHV